MSFEYDVRVNSSPRTVAELNDLPAQAGRQLNQCICATLPTFATAFPLRPISCGKTDAAES